MDFIYEKIGFESEVKTNRKNNVGSDHMVQIFGNKTKFSDFLLLLRCLETNLKCHPLQESSF